MKRDAIIRIVSLQRTENGDNSSEMSVVGTLLSEDKKTIIEYIENNAEAYSVFESQLHFKHLM